MYKKSTWNLAQKNMKKLGIYDQKPWENLEFCIWKKPCTSHCMLKGEGLKRRLNDDVHIPVPSTCIPSWGEGIETPYSTGSSWRPPSMHCLLSFIFFTFFILWPLSPAASSVSWYWSSLVCSGLAYEMYSGVGPSTYVYCVVCYCVIVALYVRSVGHVFAYLYIPCIPLLLMTIRNALWTMRLLYSLKFFSFQVQLLVIIVKIFLLCFQFEKASTIWLKWKFCLSSSTETDPISNTSHYTIMHS